MDSRTAELIALRKAAVEHTAASPIKSAPLQSALGAWASGPSPLGCAHSEEAAQLLHLCVALLDALDFGRKRLLKNA